MHTDDEIYQALDIPFVDLDFPDLELVLEDLPSLEEVLRDNPAMPLSPPPSIAETLYSNRICIRVQKNVLAKIKKRAAATGDKYQTLINSILAQYAAKLI